MANTSAFYITAEDLPDLDKKTKVALQPLLDALNRTLGSLVPQANEVPEREYKTLNVAVNSLSSTFPIIFKSSVVSPKSVILSNIRPISPGHDLSIPFVVQGWTITSKGLISITSITGLLPNEAYSLTFTIEGN
jgi:hypothetical protein